MILFRLRVIVMAVLLRDGHET